MISMVTDTNRSTQRRNIIKLCQLLSKNNPPIQEVIDTGVIPWFIEFLLNDNEPTLQFEAA